MGHTITRREFFGAPLAAFSLAGADQGRASGSLTDVPGVKVGHYTEKRRATGCTVVMVEQGAVAGVDVRGGAPGTRETDLLNPLHTVEKVHAVVLAGGSAFGLAAADGVMRYLEEKGIGLSVGRVRVPIVPAAILFDLQIGDPTIRPTAESGYRAAKAATSSPVEQGNVGAGAGATIGKMLGPESGMKAGLGCAAVKLPNGLIIGALAAVNAVGDVVDPLTGKLLAGARTPDGKHLADTMAELRKGRSTSAPRAGEHTTLGVVAVNAEWTKTQASKVAQMAHAGFARAIRPVHMPADGDTIFALGTGGIKISASEFSRIGALAADVMAQAIVSAVLQATGIPGYPAHRDFQR